MEHLKTFNDFLAVMGILVPGIVVLFVRSQFVTGRRPSSYPVLFLSYISVSLVYYAIPFPFLDLERLLYERESVNALAWFALIFACPALLGLVLGINIQKNILPRLLRRCGLNPVHAMPTAWDWKFGNMAEQWVLVTLKDNTRFIGFCGPESFISSDAKERDIYIEQIYDMVDDGNWSYPGPKGVFIAPGEVRTIEFWPYAPEENAHEQN